MKFIYCYDDITKENLIKQGYSFIKNVTHNGKDAFLFINDGVEDILTFTDNKNIEFSNKMCF